MELGNSVSLNNWKISTVYHYITTNPLYLVLLNSRILCFSTIDNY